MIVGFEGRTYTDAGGKIFMAALKLRCAPLLISGDLESPRLAIGAITTTAPLGSAVGDPFEAVDCPEGGVAFASIGGSGQWVDAFGVGCAEPSFDCHEEH